MKMVLFFFIFFIFLFFKFFLRFHIHTNTQYIHAKITQKSHKNHTKTEQITMTAKQSIKYKYTSTISNPKKTLFLCQKTDLLQTSIINHK